MGLLWSSCEPSRIAVGKKSTEHLRIDTGRPRTPPLRIAVAVGEGTV